MNASTRETLLGAVGVLGVSLAAGAVVGLAPGGVTGAVTGVNATLATGVLGVGLLGYAFSRRRRNESRDEPSQLSNVNPGRDLEDPGERFDRALLWAARDSHGSLTREARESVRERVRSTAVRAYAQRNGVSRERAAEAVAAGEWTDDVVAAAFAGDERAPRYPLRERLLGWVRPDRAYRRRAERAADAVHRFATEGSR